MISRGRVNEVLEDFKSKSVIVIGDLMLDRYMWGNVKRISPEAPVPIVEVTEEAEMPGGAGNVVLNITSLGARCIPVGVISDDRNGDSLHRVLVNGGADASGLVVCKDRPTTVKTRVIAAEQHIVRVDNESTRDVEAETEKRILGLIEELLPDADAVLFQDYNKGVLTEKVIRGTIDLAQKANVITTVDPKFENFFEYQGVTLFKPNIREAENALARNLVRNEDIDRASHELRFRLNAEYVLLTRGAHGMSLYHNTKPPVHIPTQAQMVYDVSGAGDTVISTLTLGMAAGLSCEDASILANTAAGYVVGQVGVVPITPEALLESSGD